MAFNIQLDLFGAIEKLIEFRKWNEWVKLGISLVSSFWLSSTFACGTAMIVHRPPLEAIGTGLVTGSVMATVVWRMSPLTKGMILVLPEKEAEQELKEDKQVIVK